MIASVRGAALRLRSELRNARVTPARFAVELEAIPQQQRDEWLDRLWDVEGIEADSPDLPRGCVPYLPCAVQTLLDAVREAAVTAEDVFVDVGAGAGRAALFAHLMTGAGCIGLEIQPALARTAQARADWLGLSRLRFLAGDATETLRYVPLGTVFFLYCPFGAERLQRFLDVLEHRARVRQIRVCCVDMPALQRPWLTRLPTASKALDVYQSTLASA
ncbi:MAG: class I SAM-dependent methyltransferase [Myxococcota bacterium]|jgi:predicted RNA methylase|nr:class I SAM-dependent methyltransferase [Myxococcota bacterium]